MGLVDNLISKSFKFFGHGTRITNTTTS